MFYFNPTITPIEARTKLTKNDGNVAYFNQIMGSLRYITKKIQNISYEVGLITQIRETSRQSHRQFSKSIIEIIKGY